MKDEKRQGSLNLQAALGTQTCKEHENEIKSRSINCKRCEWELAFFFNTVFVLFIGLGLFQGSGKSKTNSWWCQDSPPDKSAKGRVSVTEMQDNLC